MRVFRLRLDPFDQDGRARRGFRTDATGDARCIYEGFDVVDVGGQDE